MPGGVSCGEQVGGLGFQAVHCSEVEHLELVLLVEYLEPVILQQSKSPDMLQQRGSEQSEAQDRPGRSRGGRCLLFLNDAMF